MGIVECDHAFAHFCGNATLEVVENGGQGRNRTAASLFRAVVAHGHPTDSAVLSYFDCTVFIGTIMEPKFRLAGTRLSSVDLDGLGVGTIQRPNRALDTSKRRALRKRLPAQEIKCNSLHTTRVVLHYAL